MKIKDLIRQLNHYLPEQEIYISGDPEGNDIRTIFGVASEEIEKSNGEGTFDAVVIFPTDNIINQ